MNFFNIFGRPKATKVTQTENEKAVAEFLSQNKYYTPMLKAKDTIYVLPEPPSPTFKLDPSFTETVVKPAKVEQAIVEPKKKPADIIKEVKPTKLIKKAPGRKSTKVFKDRIIKAYQTGTPVRKITGYNKISIKALYKIIDENNVPRRYDINKTKAGLTSHSTFPKEVANVVYEQNATHNRKSHPITIIMRDILKQRKMTIKEVSKQMGIPVTSFTKLLNNNYSSFEVEYLLEFCDKTDTALIFIPKGDKKDKFFEVATKPQPSLKV